MLVGGAHDDMVFHWSRDGVELELPSPGNRIKMLGKGSLLISHIVHRRGVGEEVTDQGLYECVVADKIGSVIARRVFVEVAGEFSARPAECLYVILYINVYI